MSEELGLLLQMKRTSKLILLLVGFVAASFIVQLAIVVNNFQPDEIHQYVKGEIPLVSQDTLWSVFKPATNPGTPDGVLNGHVKN
jgi:hypothetical protein